MEAQVYKQDGTVSGAMTLEKSVFGIEPNKDVVYRAVQAELTNSRQGTHASKTRGMVSGGGKKPWKQKGRGAARAGSNRSPLWRKGGVTFGPQPHGYTYSLPKKMKALARRSVLSDKTMNKQMVVMEELSFVNIKTAHFVEMLKKLEIADKKIAVMLGSPNDSVYLAGRNLPNVAIFEAKDASVYDMIDCDIILIEKTGVEILTTQLMVK